MSSKQGSLKVSIIVAVITGLLTAGGSALITLYSDHLENSNWEKKIRYEQRLTLLNKRIELVERTVKIVNKGTAAKALEMSISNNMLSSISVTGNLEDSTKQFAIALKDNLPTQTQLVDLHSEFLSVLSLDAMFFGPKTQKAVKVFRDNNESWWNVDPKLYQNLIDSMSDEMSIGLEVYGEQYH